MKEKNRKAKKVEVLPLFFYEQFASALLLRFRIRAFPVCVKHEG